MKKKRSKSAPAMSLPVASRGAFHDDIGQPTGAVTPLQTHERLNQQSQMSGETGFKARVRRAARDY